MSGSGRAWTECRPARLRARFGKSFFVLVIALVLSENAFGDGQHMIEGWHNDDYLLLFEEAAARMTELYGVREYLPGYTAVGLRGWDDFILADAQSRSFILPTVPLELKYLEPFSTAIDRAAIQPDARFTGKVKWYVKPILFGGDPAAKDNMAWISFEQHAELVRWWSKLYRESITKNS